MDEPEIETTLKILEYKEHITLKKMSKGYQWEIKLLGEPHVGPVEVARLEDLDLEMRKKFEE